ncbi:MAG: LamG domain-containing protein [Dehalococcoidales bacterium]|nr:LamG domain-containing protein [Dehalococcoidales bacterium]
MPLFLETYGDTQLTTIQNPAVLEAVLAITGDTSPTLTTHDIVAARFSVENQIGTDPGTEDLVAYWKLDETSGDSGDILEDSAGSHDATIYGSLNPIIGVVNNGFNFVEGDSGYGRVGYANDLEFGEEQSFSICFRFRTSTATNTAFLVHKSSVASWAKNEYGFHINSTDKLDFSIGDSSNTYRLQTSYSVTDGDWHFAVGVVDRENDKFYLYVDNIKATALIAGDSDISLIGSVDNYGNDLFIGRSSATASTSYIYDGDLDEIRIYKKALSESERTFLFYNPPGGITGFQNPTSNVNANPIEISGGGIVFNQLASAPTVGSPYKGVLYLRDSGLYFIDQDGHDIAAASYEGGSWFDIYGDSGLWHPGKILIGDSNAKSLTSLLELSTTGTGSDTPGEGIFTIGLDNPYWTFRQATTNLADLVIDRYYSGSYYEAFRVERSTGYIGINSSNPDKPLSFISNYFGIGATSGYNFWILSNAYVSGADFKVSTFGYDADASGIGMYGDYITLRTYTGSAAGETINWKDCLTIGATEVTLNEGSLDMDFRVEALSMANAFFVRGSDGYVGFNEASPDRDIHITSGDSDPGIKMEASDATYGEIVYNSTDACFDFLIS